MVVTLDRCYRNLIPKHKGSKDVLPHSYSELVRYLLIHGCCGLSC